MNKTNNLLYFYFNRAKKIRSSVKLNLCKSNLAKDVLVKQMNDQHSRIVHLEEYVKQLEARLAVEQKKATALVNEGNGDGVQTAAVDLKRWYAKIDAIYADQNNALEHYYSMISKDNIVKFRLKFKRHTEDQMKSLTLDGNDLKSVCKFVFYL